MFDKTVIYSLIQISGLFCSCFVFCFCVCVWGGVFVVVVCGFFCGVLWFLWVFSFSSFSCSL